MSSSGKARLGFRRPPPIMLPQALALVDKLR
jgi:hypothetical protein